MVIDLFGLSEAEVRSQFPAVYQWVPQSRSKVLSESSLPAVPPRRKGSDMPMVEYTLDTLPKLTEERRKELAKLDALPIVPQGMVYERRPPERLGFDQDATAGSLTLGLSVTRASVSRLI